MLKGREGAVAGEKDGRKGEGQKERRERGIREISKQRKER